MKTILLIDHFHDSNTDSLESLTRSTCSKLDSQDLFLDKCLKPAMPFSTQYSHKKHTYHCSHQQTYINLCLRLPSISYIRHKHSVFYYNFLHPLSQIRVSPFEHRLGKTQKYFISFDAITFGYHVSHRFFSPALFALFKYTSKNGVPLELNKL